MNTASSDRGNNSASDGENPDGKTLWDKAGLLSNIAVPIMLGVATIVVSVVLTISSRQSEEQRAQAAALESYLTEMTALIADQKFSGPESDIDQSTRDAVRARTLGVLSRLNPEQKGLVIQFLYESALISRDSTIDLSGADLSKANLRNQTLFKVNLSGANLKEADLSHTGLFEADLSRADLSGAKLQAADMEKADLRGAALNGSDLSGARLVLANLFGADLRNAELSNASLEGSMGAIYDEGQLSEWQLEIINDPAVAFLVSGQIDAQTIDSLRQEDLFFDRLITAGGYWADEDYDNAMKQLNDAEQNNNKKNPFYASHISNMIALVQATPGKETQADYATALDALNNVAEARQNDKDKAIVEDIMILDTLAFIYLMKGIFGTDGGDKEEKRNDVEQALHNYEKIRKVRPELVPHTNLGLGLAYVENKEPNKAIVFLKAGLNQLVEESTFVGYADPQLRKLVDMVMQKAFGIAYVTGDNNLSDLAVKVQSSFYEQPVYETLDYLREGHKLVDLMRQLDESISLPGSDLGSSSDDPFDGDLFDQKHGRFLVVSGFDLLVEGDQKYPNALENFDEATDLFPEFADAFIGRAITYALLGQNEKAQQDIDQAVSLGINRDSLEFIMGLSPKTG